MRLIEYTIIGIVTGALLEQGAHVSIAGRWVWIMVIWIASTCVYCEWRGEKQSNG